MSSDHAVNETVFHGLLGLSLIHILILYMLAHVNFPLTNSQLTDFFLDHEYTTYFTLQQALNELREAGLLKMESIHNSSRYEITRDCLLYTSTSASEMDVLHTGHQLMILEPL